jgi:ParB family transcriptional regulator, chromosome partitioning protein
MTERLLQIPVDELIPDPNQPRRHFLDAELKRLAASIATRGILQPLRVIRDDERQCWRIITGESRWRAARIARLSSVPCVAVEGEVSELEILADQIIENSVRSDLKPLCLAKAMAKLKSLKRCTSQDLAAELGISGASVTRAEALLTLPDDVQAMVDDGRLAESAAYELSRLKDDDAMRELANAVVANRLNRDQVIDAVRRKVGRKHVQPNAGRVSGKLEGVSFSFSFAAGQLTPETLLKAIEQIRGKLKELQKGDAKDVAALAELLRAS